MEEKVIKFTESEIVELTDLRNEVANLFIEIGQLSVQKKETIVEIEVKEEELDETRKFLLKKEQEMYKKIGEKYGDGDIDLMSGIFTPKVEETPNQ